MMAAHRGPRHCSAGAANNCTLLTRRAWEIAAAGGRHNQGRRNSCGGDFLTNFESEHNIPFTVLKSTPSLRRPSALQNGTARPDPIKWGKISKRSPTAEME